MTRRRIDYFDDPSAPTPTGIVPAVAVAVTNAEGHLLLIHRSDNDLWSLPGGAQEVGETPLTAARREVREETGIECEITGLVGIFSNPRHVVEYTSDGEVRQEFSIVFAGRQVAGTATTSFESQEVAWVERAQVPRLPMTPGQRRRIQYFLDFNGKLFLE